MAELSIIREAPIVPPIKEIQLSLSPEELLYIAILVETTIVGNLNIISEKLYDALNPNSAYLGSRSYISVHARIKRDISYEQFIKDAQEYVENIKLK